MVEVLADDVRDQRKSNEDEWLDLLGVDKELAQKKAVLDRVHEPIENDRKRGVAIDRIDKEKRGADQLQDHRGQAESDDGAPMHIEDELRDRIQEKAQSGQITKHVGVLLTRTDRGDEAENRESERDVHHIHAELFDRTIELCSQPTIVSGRRSTVGINHSNSFRPSIPAVQSV
jgi:hypothetical protein